MPNLVDHPIVVLFVVPASGALLGAVRFGSVSAGPVGALFSGLALSWVYPELADVVPPLIGTLGLALFTYTVGLAGGSSFTTGVRRSGHLMPSGVATFAGVNSLAWILGHAMGLVLLGFGGTLTTAAAVAFLLLARGFGLGSSRLAGTLAGTRNQPAILAFAVERMDGDERVNQAYALFFPPTFIAMIICAQILVALS